MSSRCHLVYPLAPDGVSARGANDLLNEYVADESRGLALWHDHFLGIQSFTLEQYRGVGLEELAAAEHDDPRYWWRRSE